MIASRSQVSSRWLWLAAALLMLVEFLVFDRMTSRHHANIYPQWNDQIQYLTEAYSGYEQAKAHGLGHGLYAALTNPVPQGTLHDVSALLVFTLVGSPSRSAALSLNMLAFLAWQASLLFAFSQGGRSRTLGWLAFGLLPCLYWPWSAQAGSAIDFRLDHAAMCLFGLCATAALLTRGFRSAKWSAVLGIVIGLTLIERFLTSVYFVPLILATAVWISCGTEKGPRLRNLLISGLAAAALAGPVFWLNRAMLYNYYWAGQVTGADAAARIIDYTPREAVQFVFRFLWDQQLGPWFLWTVTLLTLPILGLALASFHRSFPKIRPHVDWDWLFFSLAFFLIPALVLSAHKQKSNVVLGVLVPGVLLFVGWIWSILWPRAAVVMRTFPAGRFLPVLFGLTALLAGGKFFLGRQLSQAHTAEFIEGARRVNLLADYFYSTAQAAGLTTPSIGVDRITDAFDAQTMFVICYERRKVWIPYQTLLPTGILEEKDEVIWERLSRCDFVLLTDQMPGHGHWPYDKQMLRLYPALKVWCEANLRHVDSFRFLDRQMSLYQRRALP